MNLHQPQLWPKPYKEGVLTVYHVSICLVIKDVKLQGGKNPHFYSKGAIFLEKWKLSIIQFKI